MKSTSTNELMNIIPNGHFTSGRIGQIPDGWRSEGREPALEPVFRLVRYQGTKALMMTGAGNPNCAGRLVTSFPVQGGKTYRLSVRFRMSGDVDPNANILFIFYTPEFNNGIFHFTKHANSFIEGESQFLVPGNGDINGEIWILFQYCAHGKVWISNVRMEECAPVMPRSVRVACTNGLTDLEGWSKVLDAAGEDGVDLVLLPEDIAGPSEAETMDGPSPTLLSAKAAQHKMYVAGGFMLRDTDLNLTHTVCALFGRSGELVGIYRKNHLYITEILVGITPGEEAPVFDTDFGKVGSIICYDSFFTDVIELEALKGAEIILFPNAGYYRSLMPARAADNGVRIVVSSWNDGYGIWDTSGHEITGQNPDISRTCNCEDMFSDVKTLAVEGAPVFACDSRGIRETNGKMEILFATLDLSISAAPHHRTGPMTSGPGGHRNRRGQRKLLLDEIKREYFKW